MSFLDYNLARMGSIDRRNQQKFQQESEDKKGFNSHIENLVNTLNRGREQDKQRDFTREQADRLAGTRSLEAGQKRQHDVMMDYNETQRRADEAKTGFGYDKQLQYIRNEGSGPGAEDYNLYEVTDRAISDIYGTMEGLFVDDKFQGWGAVDKTQLEDAFMANISLSRLRDEDKELALTYFKQFLADVENGDVTPEDIEEAQSSGEGIFSKLITGIKKIGQGDANERAEQYGTEQLLSSIEEVQNTQPKFDPVAWDTMQSLLDRLSENTDPGDAQIANYYLNEAKDGKLEPHLMDKFLAFLKEIAPNSEVSTGLNPFGGL